MSTKMSVIRSLFCRAYHYFDPLFLDNGLEKIYTDFSRLGYNRRFIVKAKISAKKGRCHEIKVRAGIVEPFPLVLPYHKKTRGLKQLYAERGIEVIYTSRDSLGSRVTRRKCAPMESGVNILKFIDLFCDKVYVGESSYFPKRFDEHRRTISGVESLKRYATARHKHPSSGLMLDADNALIPHRSSSFTQQANHCLSICLCLTNLESVKQKVDMGHIYIC